MKPIIKNSLALMLLLFPAIEVLAKSPITCKPTKATESFNMSASGNIFIGPDMPIGTVFYRSNITTSYRRYPVRCSADISNPADRYSFDLIESTQLISTSGTPVFGPGIPPDVYSTNLPGVGIQYKVYPTAKTLVPGRTEETKRTTHELFKDMPELEGGNGLHYETRPWTYFSLIKIGPIMPGNVSFSSSNKSFVDAKASPGDAMSAPSFPFLNTEVFLTGSVNISSSTCQTPTSFNVSLGSYEVRAFPDKGSSSKWINSDIHLIGCPAFKGYYSGKKYNAIDNALTATEIGSMFPPSPDPNEIKLTLKPHSPIIAEYPGTFAINDEPGAAYGIGIQLSHNDAGTDFAKFNIQKAFEQPPSLTPAGNITIPLKARYIRTDDRISAGSANGAVTFTIDYY